MFDKVQNFLNTEHGGFSGLNHVLIAIALFVALFFIPFEPITSLVEHMRTTPVTLIISFLVICGAALLPDLDNMKGSGGSSAGWDLGIFGDILSAIMVTISSIMTSIFHGKRDVHPDTQHRFFWHTLLIPLIIGALVFFFVPSGDTKLIDLFSSMNSWQDFPVYGIAIPILIFICVYVGSALLLRKISKFLPIANFRPGLLALLLGLGAAILSIVSATQTDLRFYGFCVMLGYLFHLIGDLVADSGIPLLFPVTGIFGQFWMRIRLIPKVLTVTTGSTLETILKFIFAAADMILLYLLFTLVLLK